MADHENIAITKHNHHDHCPIVTSKCLSVHLSVCVSYSIHGLTDIKLKTYTHTINLDMLEEAPFDFEVFYYAPTHMHWHIVKFLPCPYVPPETFFTDFSVSIQ